MSFQFCWEHRKCDKTCQVRDLRLLFCWNLHEEEAQAGLRGCGDCDYRLAWETSGYKAERFPFKAPSPDGEGRRKRILVVDDEPNILYALEESVRVRGLECISARDGHEGLLIARGMSPDLIVSDVIMPRLNGYELCHMLKSDPDTARIPIILVTVRASDRERMDGRLAGADAYITKPFSPRQLEENIRLLLG